jgi:hypothetical protein
VGDVLTRNNNDSWPIIMKVCQIDNISYSVKVLKTDNLRGVGLYTFSIKDVETNYTLLSIKKRFKI